MGLPWSAQAQANKTQGNPRTVGGKKVLLINLEEQGPIKIDQAAFAVLKPAIAIERHDDVLEISIRFNLQTSIQDFDEADAEHAHCFQDVSLQYLYGSSEDFAVKPVSDPLEAFQVTDVHAREETTGPAPTGAYPTSSGFTQHTVLKKAYLETERKVNSWALAVLTRTSAWGAENRIACQWFWQANSGFLSTDVAVGVTRSVVITRHVPIGEIYDPKTGEFTIQNMKPYLSFDFRIRIHLRELGHSSTDFRTNPTNLHNPTSNPSEVLPAGVYNFNCKATRLNQDLLDQIPTEDTADMVAITENLQNRHQYGIRNAVIHSMKGSMMVSSRGSSIYDVLTMVDGY